MTSFRLARAMSPSIELRVVLAAAGVLASASGCGGEALVPGDTGGGSGGDVEATSLFTATDGACGESIAPETAAQTFESAEGETVAVVEVFYADECTGLGGQYLLARQVDGPIEYWLGSHGCRFFADALVGTGPVFGVLRASQTAALFQIEEGICIGFPGGDGVQSSCQVQTIALFDSEADARAFAAQVSPDSRSLRALLDWRGAL